MKSMVIIRGNYDDIANTQRTVALDLLTGQQDEINSTSQTSCGYEVNFPIVFFWCHEPDIINDISKCYPSEGKDSEDSQ
ncbi:Homoserine kinase [Dirofilaria immitis]